MEAVHPTGSGSQKASTDLHLSFGPEPVDHAGVAAAAGGAHAATVKTAAELGPALDAAIKAVAVEKRTAVIDCWIQAI
jgi:acetolactate synthase I/II/III large subunit